MSELNVSTIVPTEVVTPQPAPETAEVVSPVVPAEADATVAERVDAVECNGDGADCRHARAGRKGARRVHELIEEGRLYEKEHGLKRGLQRLRQLIELGKLYEQEHGLRPNQPRKQGQRLSRPEREELVATFLQCLVRMVKPSFRAELTRLAEALQQATNNHAA